MNQQPASVANPQVNVSHHHHTHDLIPRFNGDINKTATFIRLADIFMNSNQHISEIVRLQYVMAKLTDNALEFILAQPTLPGTWAEFKNLLNNEFKLRKTVNDVLDEINSLVFNPNETYNQFIQTLKCYGYQARSLVNTGEALEIITHAQKRALLKILPETTRGICIRLSWEEIQQTVLALEDQGEFKNNNKYKTPRPLMHYPTQIPNNSRSNNVYNYSYAKPQVYPMQRNFNNNTRHVYPPSPFSARMRQQQQQQQMRYQNNYQGPQRVQNNFQPRYPINTTNFNSPLKKNEYYIPHPPQYKEPDVSMRTAPQPAIPLKRPRNDIHHISEEIENHVTHPEQFEEQDFQGVHPQSKIS